MAFTVYLAGGAQKHRLAAPRDVSYSQVLSGRY